MADPVTLGLIFMGASTLMSAAGGIKQGQDADDAAKANAEQSMLAGAAKAEQIKEDGRRVAASARARYGASGVDFIGSPFEVEADIAKKAKLDELYARYSGESKASLMRWEGKQKKTASYWGAGQSILTGASGVLNQYSKNELNKEWINYQKTRPYTPWDDR